MARYPLVSIIMAAKDAEPYLPTCLDSILDQIYSNWELIVVNDHSNDRTPEILQRYAEMDSRIRIFHSKRYGIIPTLKEGYQYARGIFINRMDADDRMPHDKLEVLVREWEKYGKKHVIVGGTEHFVDKGEVGGGFRRYEQWLNDMARKNNHYGEIYQECVIPSHCWIIHKDDFDTVGAFNPEVYPEDYDLCFRFYRAGLKIIGIDKILHYWRDRPDRISRTCPKYKDNRYFGLKLPYFYELNRDVSRPLVVWGAGRNGKDLVKLILQREKPAHWVCNNQNKVGRDIYGIVIEPVQIIPTIQDPQILLAVASPHEKANIKKHLLAWGMEPARDFWFFV